MDKPWEFEEVVDTLRRVDLSKGLPVEF